MLTEIDKKILAELRKNGRASWVSLAKKLSVSRITIQSRVDSMQVRKIIKGYTIVEDIDSSTDETSEVQAFFMIKFSKNDTVFTLQKLLADSPHHADIWGVAGDWDCFVLLKSDNLQSIAELREYIHNHVQIERMETRPVLNSF